MEGNEGKRSEHDTDWMTSIQHHDPGKKLKAFPLTSGINSGNLHSPLLFSTVLEILAKAVRQEKDSDTQEGRSQIVLKCR